MKTSISKLFVTAVSAACLTASLAPVNQPLTQAVVAEAKTTVKLSTKKATLYTGNSIKLKLKGVSSKVKWSSSDSSVARVSGGKVTALQAGTATITAKYKKKSYKCSITVKSATLSENTITLQQGQGYPLGLNNTNAKGDWTSEDVSVATVNANGFIVPVDIGSTKIDVNVGNETYSCTVNVVKRFDVDDFNWYTSKEGFTNYVDYMNSGTGKYSRFTYRVGSPSAQNDSRGINIGGTYAELEAAYGYCGDYKQAVSDDDTFSDRFENSKYPRYKVVLTYHDSDHQKYFYKSFYFDRTDSVVLIGLSAS